MCALMGVVMGVMNFQQLMKMKNEQKSKNSNSALAQTDRKSQSNIFKVKF